MATSQEAKYRSQRICNDGPRLARDPERGRKRVVIHGSRDCMRPSTPWNIHTANEFMRDMRGHEAMIGTLGLVGVVYTFVYFEAWGNGVSYQFPNWHVGLYTSKWPEVGYLLKMVKLTIQWTMLRKGWVQLTLLSPMR